MLYFALSSVLSITVFIANVKPVFSFPYDKLPTRDIAGISVLDTPIVRQALEFTRTHSDDFTYNHVVRSWILGTAAIQRMPKFNGTIDLEVVAIGTLMHDLGWDITGTL